MFAESPLRHSFYVKFHVYINIFPQKLVLKIVHSVVNQCRYSMLVDFGSKCYLCWIVGA